MSSTGFGICGKKNVYSSRTKIGNYVEDRIGKALAASIAKAPGLPFGSTVVRDDFIQPSKMAQVKELPGDSSQVVSAKDIKTKNREGVSFDLLFGHIRDGTHADELNQERFHTTASKSFTTTNEMPASIREDLVRVRSFRARKLITEESREQRLQDALTTTAKMQSSRMS